MSKKAKKKRVRYLAFLNDERLRLTFGIFFILFALYLYLAFISYFFTWKTDQSFEWSRVFSGPELMVDNWGGKFGAFMANKFINHWFGLSSLLLPFILLVGGLRMIRIKTFRIGKTIRNCLLGTILLSIVLSYLFADAGGFLGSGPGGGHGYFLSEWVSSVLGKTGTAFLLAVLALAFILFSFDRAVDWLVGLFKSRKSPAEEPSATDETEPDQEGWTSPEETITPVTDDQPKDDQPEDESVKFKTREADTEARVESTEDASGTPEYQTDADGIEMTVEKAANGEQVNGDPDTVLEKYRAPA